MANSRFRSQLYAFELKILLTIEKNTAKSADEFKKLKKEFTFDRFSNMRVRVRVRVYLGVCDKSEICERVCDCFHRNVAKV